VAPSANAAEDPTPSMAQFDASSTAAIQEFTPEQIRQAIIEARTDGYVTNETTAADGTRTTTLDLGDGFTFDLVDAPDKQRIGAGSDSRGVYVSFNATDQNMIISSAAFVLGAAICAVSGGTFCVVAGAILTVATVAITGSGAIRCGTKQLRVYPFAGGKVKPRCA
jgi:hypothetical protein